MKKILLKTLTVVCVIIAVSFVSIQFGFKFDIWSYGIGALMFMILDIIDNH